MNRRDLLLGGALSVVAAARAGAQYQPQGKALVQRLADLQTPEGAVLLPGAGAAERACNARAANWGVYGMLLGAPPRSRSQSAGVAKSWITWFVSHVGRNGALDTFRGTPAALRATGPPEHTDGTSGTFLSVAYAYHEQTGDAPTLLERYDGLVRIADAGMATQQKSGLTHASRDEPVAYLVNNLEIWQGLNHFARLSKNLRKRNEAKHYAAEAEKLFDAIEQWLWTPSEGVYAAALHPSGKRETAMDRWRPGMEANLSAIAILPVEERRDALLKRLAPMLSWPEKISRSEPLERFIGWALAAIPHTFQDTLEQVQVRLAKVEWDAIRDLSPALIGHALRIGRGQLTPLELV